MISQELLNYISDCRTKGLSDEKIRQALVDIGWSQSDINQALSTSPDRPIQNSNPIGITGVSEVNGLNGPFPPELRTWNTGAFCLPLFWGISHGIWLALLTLISPLSLILAIVLGVKGNEMAWKSRKFESIEHFKLVQSIWAKWGLGCLIFQLVLLIGLVLRSNFLSH
jgi:hypothetical protein